MRGEGERGRGGGGEGGVCRGFVYARDDDFTRDSFKPALLTRDVGRLVNFNPQPTIPTHLPKNTI
jgi:hypothetical protein